VLPAYAGIGPGRLLRCFGCLERTLDSLELLPLVRMHLEPGVLNVGVKGERVNP
jgi:hypothetical protein